MAEKVAHVITGFDPVYGGASRAGDPGAGAEPVGEGLLSGEFKEGDPILVDANAAGPLTFVRQEGRGPVPA